MARIKKEDIFDPKLFTGTTQEIRAMIEAIKLLKSEMIAVLKVQKEALATTKPDNSESIKKQANAINQVTQATQNLTALEKEEVRLTQRLAQSRTQQAQANAKLKQQIIEQNKANKKRAQEELKLLSVYQKESAKLNELRKRYKDLALQNKQNTAEGKKLLANIQQLDTRLKKVDATVGQFQRNVGNYGSALNRLGAGFKSLMAGAGVMLGVAGVFRVIRGGVETVKEFEQASANLASVLGKATDSTGTWQEKVKELTDDAKRLGSTTVFTAGEVAELQTAYARLGFTQSEILDVTESTLDASAALGSELGAQAELTGAVIRSFGFSADEAGRVNDVLAKATSTSALSFEKLSTALPTVSAVANTAGVSLERTTALLGTLSDRGIDASTSATALRNVFLTLSKKGLTFQQAMNKINNATDKNAEALELFGKRGATVGVILSETQDSVSRLTEELENADGTAQQMAETQKDTLAGSIKLLQSAWDGLMLSIAEGGRGMFSLTGIIRFLADNLVTIVKVLVLLIQTWATYKLSLVAINVVTKIYNASMVTARLVTIAFRHGLKGVTRAMKIFNITMKSMPWGLLLTGITTALTALGLFGDKVDATKEKIDKLKKADEEAKKQLEKEFQEEEKDVQQRIKDIDVEIAKLKDRGATEQEINAKTLEQEQIKLDLMKEQYDEFYQYAFERSALEDKYYNDWRNNQIEMQELQKTFDKIIKDGTLSKQEQLDVEEQIGFKLIGNQNQMLSTIKATISMYRRQSEEAKKLENEQAKLNEATWNEVEARGEAIKLAEKDLEISQIEKEFQDDQVGTVAYYRSLIKDANELLINRVKTRERAKIIQKEIADLELKIKEILGDQSKESTKQLNLFESRLYMERELAKLKQERLDIEAKQEREITDQRIYNLENLIELEKERLLAQASSKEFVAEGQLSDTTALKDLIDQRTELEIKNINDSFKREKEKLEEELRLLKEKLDREVKEKKISREHADKIIKSAENNLNDELNLLALERRGDIKQANDERVQAYEDANQEIIDTTNATIDQIDSDNLELADAELETLRLRAQNYRAFADIVSKISDNLTKRQIDNINLELDASRKRAEELKRLSEQGNSDAEESVAREEARIQELELKKLKVQRRQQLIEAGISAFRAYAGKLEQGDTNPVGSTIKDLSTLSAFIASLPTFYEGTENVGDALGKPDLAGRDGHIVRVDSSERIVDPKNNAKLEGISNDELGDMASYYKNKQIKSLGYAKMMNSTKELMAYQWKTNEAIVSKFDEIKKSNNQIVNAIQRIPFESWNYDEMSNAVIQKIKTQKKTEIKHLNNGGLF